MIDIPLGWKAAAGEILLRNSRKVFILGGTDSGKSTFCSFLYDFLINMGKSAAIIDADVGQKDIGPPACITSGIPGEDPGGAEMTGCYFVGNVTPVRHFLPMVVGVSELTESARADFKIINTTGLVHGIGRPLKEAKIEAVKPDVIIAIQRSNELEVLLRSLRNLSILRIAASGKAALKSPNERRAAREKAFSSYFKDAPEHRFSLDKLIFQRSLIFNGEPVRNPQFIYCEKSAEGILAVTAGKLPYAPRFRTIPPGFEENLLCGVADIQNACLGLARVRRIDFRRRTITLLTPVEPMKIAIVQFGDIYVDNDGKEGKVSFRL